MQGFWVVPVCHRWDSGIWMISIRHYIKQRKRRHQPHNQALLRWPRLWTLSILKFRTKTCTHLSKHLSTLRRIPVDRRIRYTWLLWSKLKTHPYIHAAIYKPHIIQQPLQSFLEVIISLVRAHPHSKTAGNTDSGFGDKLTPHLSGAFPCLQKYSSADRY